MNREEKRNSLWKALESSSVPANSIVTCVSFTLSTVLLMGVRFSTSRGTAKNSDASRRPWEIFSKTES